MRPIVVALNKLPGVRIVRNANLGPVVPWSKRFDPAARPIIAGLGEGSADIVGVVAVEGDTLLPGWICQTCGGFTGTAKEEHVACRACGAPRTPKPIIGRLFCLEVKLPKSDGKRKGALAADQKRWLDSVRRFGGYAAVVHSVDEAKAAVLECRRGHSGESPF